LAIKSSRLLKSLCWRISATSAFSSILRTPFKRAISASVPLCARVAAGLVSVFCPSHVLGNLLHEGQTLSKRDQSRIRRGVDLAHVSRAKRDQSGIYLVVLRALQVKLRIGAHLRGLEHNHHKTPSAQLRHHLTLISAARLNTYALDPMLAQPPRESSVTLGIIVNLQPQPARERHFELAFAGINPGHTACYACSSSSTFPCDANPWFLQPSRSDEESRSRSCYGHQSFRAGAGYDRTIGGSARAATRAGPFLMERSQCNGSR